MIAGTSAGAVVQSANVMIVRGKSNRGIVEGAHEGCEYDRSALQYISGGGFGFFEYGIIDSHFSERGREGRSIRLASDTGIDMVFGIDEATSLVVTEAHSPNARMKVIGQNGVQIFDLSKAVTKINDQGLWSIKNVKSSYLTEGDQYIPKKGKIIFDPKKKSISNQEAYRGRISSSKDIFSSRKGAQREFINQALKLVNTLNLNVAYGYPRSKDAKYKVVLNKTERTKAYYFEQDDERLISYTGLKIAIRPKE